MRARLFLSVLVLAAVLLSACQSATPTPAQTEAPPSDVYPAPLAQETSPPVKSGPVLYPDVQSGSEVSWEAAKAMILNGEVAKITEQVKTVTLDLKDGRSLTAVEDNPGDVQKVVDSCGDPCKGLAIDKQ